MTRRVLEIETLAAFDAHVRRARNLNGWFVQSLDLTERVEALLSVDPRGAVFLGCRFSPLVEDHLRRAGALIFPRLPELPFDPYRAGLYDAVELYGSGRHEFGAYPARHDAVVYACARSDRATSLAGALSTALHDHAITDALNDATETIAPRRVVGIMGGHALLRTNPTYAEAARLASTLCAAGRLVLTGGGPGAMEAANLGAYLSPWSEALPEALTMLAAAPAYTPSVDAWVASAGQVRERWPVAEAGRSLSIPTWFYGHEPTNLFATMIAKYFANALREDTLLHRCRGGIVFFPGQAGTVQEIFQAVTENFYAAEPALIAPMILVGVDYWTAQLPAWPLLQRLGANRAMGEVIHCVDDVAAVPDLLARF
ncbi:MAG TPA: Rossmann fold nucleotide-binding protein [Propionibacteriaceae bacterium]|nr:Rossmann fold nucleotide-binding protein [Propionibacteriaceae bacterium]